MKLTTKGKFAITALLDIALYSQTTSPITLQNISHREDISISYLEQLFVKLRRHGMVKSFKGPGGGYILAKSPEEINLAQIINAVDEDMDARTCMGQRNCHNNKQCLTHDLWSDLTNHVYNYLNNVTLKDLVDKSTTKPINLTIKN